MGKIGISVDYSNICKDYNTVYLDRDNDDRATVKCMKAVLEWTKGFITELTDTFGYTIYRINDSAPADVDEVASKRFLFYSLEKEITLQKYLLQKEYRHYDPLSLWANEAMDSVIIENDENGGCLYLYFNDNSKEHLWITQKLSDFSLDEVPFEVK